MWKLKSGRDWRHNNENLHFSIKNITELYTKFLRQRFGHNMESVRVFVIDYIIRAKDKRLGGGGVRNSWVS